VPLVKRGNSRFWYVQFQLNHKTFVRSTKTTDRKEAERLEVKFRAEAYAEGVLGKKRSISVEQAIERLITSKVGTPNAKNLGHHRVAVLGFLKGSAALSSLTNTDLEGLKQNRLALGRAPQTVKHELNLLMQAIRLAKRLGFETPDLVAPTIKVSPTRLRYLSVDEEARLLRELDPLRTVNGLAPLEARDPKTTRDIQDNYDLVVILLDTGARYNEIAGLRWDQIDLDRSVIRLWRSKVSNESLIFMTKRVRAIIANRLMTRSSKYLFSNSKGGARGYRVIAIRKAFHRAGLHDCTVHTLRHTHASRLIQNGMSVYEVKSVLGHADIRTTMRYAHLEQASVTSKARDLIEKLQNPGVF
jgi:integrase